MAFESNATNLVAGDTNNRMDVFVRDTQAETTIRVSVSTSGEQANGDSLEPHMSADGRYVAFTSYAWNLLAGDTNSASDAFLHDLVTGATTRISVSSTGTQANLGSYEPYVSADGRFVVFESPSSNLVSGYTDTYGAIYLRDVNTGQTSLVSIANDGSFPNNRSSWPSVSADGRYVAFDSKASNLVSGDTNAAEDVFVRDRQLGMTTRISTASSGTQANGWSKGMISQTGRFIAFSSIASNLVAGDTNGAIDAFLRDLQTGLTIRVSVGADGSQANEGSYAGNVSDDGRFVTFESTGSNLVSGDSNGKSDIFLRDLWGSTTTRASVTWDGSQADGSSHSPAVSTDGRHIAFSSDASNLATVPGPGLVMGFGPTDVYQRSFTSVDSTLNASFFGLWAPTNDKIQYARKDRTFFTPGGAGRVMRSRGYIPDDAIVFGAMCVTKSGNFRPECTAQSHAIRKLGDLVNGDYDPGNRVEWEVGKATSDSVCPDQDIDECEPVTDSGFRVDIVTVPSNEGGAGGPYGLIEVKRWSVGAPLAVRDQLSRYSTALGPTGVGLSTDTDGTLNNLNGVGWAISYQDDNTGEVWYAWAPNHADENLPFKSGDTTNFSYGDGEDFRGDVYFAPEDETPQAVKNRAEGKIGDVEYHRLVLYSEYAAFQVFKLWHPERDLLEIGVPPFAVPPLGI